MDFAQQKISPGLWLDSRRAVFLEGEGILAVTDLHLGYAWAHRFHGQLIPLHPADCWADRLAALCDTYQPPKVVILGDIVHQAVPVPALEEEIQTLADRFCPSAELILLLGNHDRALAGQTLPPPLKLQRCYRSGEILFIHGDTMAEQPPARLTLMGHEHPAISLGDGAGTAAKFPCFLLSPTLIVLPAFSLWVSGSDIRSYPRISPLARDVTFDKAIAIMGNRLLPIPLGPQRTPRS